MDINLLREQVLCVPEEDLHKNHSLSMTTMHEKKFLHQVVKLLEPESVLVELGCYSGGSISVMANSNPTATMYTIDLFSINGTDLVSVKAEHRRIKDLLAEFKNVIVYCGNTILNFNWWSKPIDLLFVDAAHEDPILSLELAHWLPFLKPGGILMMHDNHIYFPDVQQQVNRLIESGEYDHIDQVDTLAVFIKRDNK